MSDELNAFERLDADMPLPLDLRALEDRVIDDSLAWEARVPSAERLMRFARELPGSGAPQTDEPTAGGGPGPRSSVAPERIRHRAAPGHAPRRHALAAYAAAFGLMTLTTLLLVQLASFRMVGTSVPPQRAEATATSSLTSSTPTRVSESSPTAMAAPSATPGTDGGSSVGSVGFVVTRTIVDIIPAGWESDTCGATMPFTLAVRFNASSVPALAPIVFRWLHSDGYASVPATF